MSDPGRALYTVNDMRNQEIASLSAKIISEITHNWHFLITPCFILYSISDIFPSKTKYYPLCTENNSVNVVVDSDCIDFNLLTAMDIDICDFLAWGLCAYISLKND